MYTGRELRCAIYIILSLELGFQTSEYYLPMSVRPGGCFRGIGRQQNQLKISYTATYLLFLLCPRRQATGAFNFTVRSSRSGFRATA